MTQRRPPKERLYIATLQGSALWSALGYKNARAFQRAVHAGRVGVPLFPVPGQSRGWFARAEDVAQHRKAAAEKASPSDYATNSAGPGTKEGEKMT